MFMRKDAVISDLRSSFSEAAPLGGMSKRSFDITCALLILLLMLPLFIGVALLIIVTDRRPFFIRHKRIGHGGAEFPCLKFRTMVVNSSEVLAEHLLDNPAAQREWLAKRKLRNDPRITQIGHVLRKSSVDELPQLINILRGEMSFVGPRPIVQEEVRFYGAHLDDYIKARPGLTGLWQISGRSDSSYEERVRLDRTYVARWSFWKDVSILFKTIPAVMTGRGSY